MAPSWISISKALPVDSKPRKWPASRIWPVEDTGMNSVSPSSRPSMQGFDDGLAFHGFLGPCATANRTACLSWREVCPYRSQLPDGPLNRAAKTYRCGPAIRQCAFIIAELMLTLFHHPMFATCRFVRLAFGEYGEELALIEEKPWTRRKEFLALNPAGTLPVLLAEGDVPIVGAAVIAEYLDETRGVLKRDSGCLPKTRCDRAEIRRLADWYLNKTESEVTRHLVRERVLKPLMPSAEGGGSPDSGAIRAARANIRQHMKYTNWLAGTRHWLAGSTVTYADLAAAATLSVLDYLGEIDWREYPAAARLVYAGEIAALVPAAAQRPRARPVAGVALCGPRLLMAASGAIRKPAELRALIDTEARRGAASTPSPSPPPTPSR